MAIYLNYSQEELNRQYEHRHFVADVPKFRAIAKAENERVRAAASGLFDIPYGTHFDELLDIYKTHVTTPVPVVIFFHGGRWRKGSKSSACHSAEAFTENGAHFVSVNYSLLPTVTMDELINQCRKAVAWIHENAASFGGDPSRISIMGKSAGAHIGGMMVTTDWTSYGAPTDVIKSALLISGMYDLEPVRLTFRNEWLRLDRDSAVRNSPIHHIKPLGCSLVLGCGELETDEFRRQTREFAAAWRTGGHRCHYAEAPDQHHYSVNLFLQRSPLFERMRDVMRLGRPSSVGQT
jgi:arylformamidase